MITSNNSGVITAIFNRSFNCLNRPLCDRYEIIAEATGRVDEWLPNPNEHIIAPYHRSETKSRVLEPALKDGILPLYIRYSTVCDEDLDASTWVSRLITDAIKQLLKASPQAGGTAELSKV